MREGQRGASVERSKKTIERAINRPACSTQHLSQFHSEKVSFVISMELVGWKLFI